MDSYEMKFFSDIDNSTLQEQSKVICNGWIKGAERNYIDVEIVERARLERCGLL